MPRYTNHTLGPSEKILAEAHYHWFYWAKRIALCAVIMAIGLALDAWVFLAGIATIVAAVICVIDLVCAYIVYQNDEMVITNHRVILKTGFFSRDVFEMQIQKIETVLVDQSIMGRFFDYGTIACRGTGGTSSKQIEIGAPLAFRAAFQAAVKESQSESIRTEIQSAVQTTAAAGLQDEKLDEIIRLLRSIESKLPVVLLLVLLWPVASAMAKDYQVTSPDGHLQATVSDAAGITWSISRDGAVVLQPSAIDITTAKGSWAAGARVKQCAKSKISRQLEAINYKCSVVNEQCGEMRLTCSGEFDLVVRAYNDGCAYRLVSKSRKPVTVTSETAGFAFATDCQAFVPYVNDNRGGERYCYSFESYYDEQLLSAMFADSLAITPLAVCLPDGVKAVVMETAVENYPGMFLKKADGHALTSEFAPLPTETIIGGFDRLNLVPVKRADYIAELMPRQALPWRLVLVTTEDKQLLATTTPYCLAPECRLEDTSWIKAGKVAWDWWNNWNISGVDFRAGINTPTYKHYIDFAQRNAIEYIIVDEGWSSQEDLLQYSNDELSIPELVAYGQERGVGVILWSSWRNLIKDMEHNMAHYAAAGVKGFKVDFFDRDDQEVIRSSYEIAACAARHHLLVDYHGLKPSGVQRAYPNVVNFEGVKGLENCKWEPRVGNGPLHDMPRYDVSIPYLRMLPGPMDYTPGAMLNATRDHFFGNNDHPMSQGTRVHQMAMYTLFEAPLQMLADSPTHYEQNQECTTFIAGVPTTFDETVPLCGEMGEYVAIARRKGDVWFVAAMNNWTPRTLTLNLADFLTGPMQMDSFADGVNADREATDYKHELRTVTPDMKITLQLAPAGGWTAKFVKP